MVTRKMNSFNLKVNRNYGSLLSICPMSNATQGDGKLHVGEDAL